MYAVLVCEETRSFGCRMSICIFNLCRISSSRLLVILLVTEWSPGCSTGWSACSSAVVKLVSTKFQYLRLRFYRCYPWKGYAHLS